VEVTLGLTDAVGDTLGVVDAVGVTLELELGLTLIDSDDVEDIDVEGLNVMDSVGVMLELGLELRVTDIDDEGDHDGDTGITAYERDTMGSPTTFGAIGTGF